MAHPAQIAFCNTVMLKFPEYFKGKTVLDVGSLDINGCNRSLFMNCEYTGVDICEGKNVDFVGHLLEFETDKQFDVVISTEALEHDRAWGASLIKMMELLKPNGLLVLTCASGNRPPHGTSAHKPEDSPKTNDWYKNLSAKEVLQWLDIDNFRRFEVINTNTDLYFWGIKR